MKLQIDTGRKTIKVDEPVNISKLVTTLKKMFPQEWKEFSLVTESSVTASLSFSYTPQTYPRWWEQPWYTTGRVTTGDTNGDTIMLKNEVYDVEI